MCATSCRAVSVGGGGWKHYVGTKRDGSYKFYYYTGWQQTKYYYYSEKTPATYSYYLYENLSYFYQYIPEIAYSTLHYTYNELD